MTWHLLAIPGDGIGQEVIPQAVRVLQAVDPEVRVVWGDAGWATFRRTGTALPADTLRLAHEVDAVLFGATASPPYRVAGYQSPILALRRAFELCVNLRPIRLWPGVPALHPRLAVWVVRENCEGLYIQEERSPEPGVAEAVRRITRQRSLAVAQEAFRLAMRLAESADRPPRVTVVHKANVLPLTDGLFREAALQVAQAFPQVEVEEMLVDAAAMHLVRSPERFEVVLAPNLYGDILSDLAAGLAGGLGLAPAANLGRGTPVFEPVHGSAPDIAGRGVANPTAAILAAALALDHLGRHQAARWVEQALERTLREGYVTPDLGGEATTVTFTDRVLQHLVVLTKG